MSAIRSGSRWLPGLLSVALTASSLPGPVAAQADAPLSFALPMEGQLGGHASLMVDDMPASPPAAFDLAAAEELSLDQADLLPAEEWEVEGLASALGEDPLRALAFVRERIALDPYRGVLRGAEGTLAARSGSAADRAVLLRAILEAQGHTGRFAFAELGDAAADALLGSALAGPARPIDDVPSAEVMAIDAAALLDRARRDHALLLTALEGSFPPGIGPAEEMDPSEAFREHAWVQVRMADGSWLDLDPSAAPGGPSPSLAPPTGTAETMPPEAHHAVTLRVVAESLIEGVVVESVVLEEDLVAAEAAGAELWLHFRPEASGVAGGLLEAMGEASWLPVLLVDEEARTGTSFGLGGGDGDDLFGDFLGDGGPELAALRLEVESLAPGQVPRISERLIYDRVPAAERADRMISAQTLEALPPDGTPPPGLSALHHVMISTGGASLRDHAVGRAFAANFLANELADPELATGFALQDLLLPLAAADQTLVLASERLIVDGLVEAAAGRAFVGRPRVFLSTFTQRPDGDDTTAMVTDLVLDDVAVLSPPGSAADLPARLRLWYGALQTALETELALQRAAAVDPATRTLGSVSLETRRGLTLLGDEQVADLPATAVALRRAHARGALVVVAGDIADSTWFWVIEPVTGSTSSVHEPGLRIGSVGGGNYTNASQGGPRWVVDPRTGNTVGHIKDGTYYRYGRRPPTRCSGGPEYVVILGCVSIPASWVTGVTVGATVVAVVAWSAAIIGTLRALR